jgi:hypothetical protein
VGSGTAANPSSTKLFARACAPGKASQLWQLSHGVQPRDSVATLIELAGSNRSSSITLAPAPATDAAPAGADKMCWRVLACLSTEGATVGCGMGCTPLPPRSPTGRGYECGGHNCACNGGFAFHNDGTIRSLMDGHCVELTSAGGAAAVRAGVLGAGSFAGASDQEMLVQMASCSGSATQQFTAKPQPGSSGAYTISQVPSDGGGSLCVESDFKQGPSPPPPLPPSPPCPTLKNETACTHAPPGKHCFWQNGTCVRLPPPAPPPKPVPQPAVPPEDYDSHFEITDNWIHDMPLEYHSAIGIFAGYIANSTIAHNSMERLSYDGASAYIMASRFPVLLASMFCLVASAVLQLVSSPDAYCPQAYNLVGAGDKIRSQARSPLRITRSMACCRMLQTEGIYTASPRCTTQQSWAIGYNTMGTATE